MEELSKEQLMLLIHACSWAIDRMNNEKKEQYAIKHIEEFERSISEYEELKAMFKNKL